METLYRQVELFQDLMQASAQYIPLGEHLFGAIPKQKTIFPVSDKHPEQVRQFTA